MNGTRLIRSAFIVASATCLFAAPAISTGDGATANFGQRRNNDSAWKQAEKERLALQNALAVQHYDQYLKRNPRDDDALERRALCIFWSGNSKDGIDSLSRLLAHNPKFWSAYLHRANMRCSLGDQDGALADVNLAIKTAGSTGQRDAYAAKVGVLRGMHRYQEAARLATEKLREPEFVFPNMHMELARVYADMGDIEKADEQFSAAEKLVDCPGWYHVEHANLYQKREPAKCLRMLDDHFSRTERLYLQGHPPEDFAYTMQQLYRSFRQVKDNKRARDCVQWLLRATQSDPEWLIEAADVSSNLNETAEAMRYIKQIRDYQFNAGAVNQMVVAYRLQRNVSSAEGLMETYLERHPQDLEMRATLAEVFVQDAHLDEALRWIAYPEAEKSGGSPRYWRVRSETAQMAGNFPLAAQAASRAIAEDPKNQMLYLLRANALFRMKKYQEALSDCNRALAMLPNSAGEYSLRGMIYFKLGDRPAALNDFSYAVEHAGVNEQHSTRATRAMALACQSAWGNARKDSLDAFKVRPTGLDAFVVAAEIDRAVDMPAEAAAMEDSAFLLQMQSQSFGN